MTAGEFTVGPTIAADYYDALVRRDADYDGLFYVGVRTTGVFCRPTCPARKPKKENCEFFPNAKSALHAGFRPCKRCRPLAHPNDQGALGRLVEAIEKEPHKRWRDRDFRALGIDQSTARRRFKKRFGMTFMEYARASRMGLALTNLRGGASVIEAQLAAGYESGSGFREAYSRIIGAPPKDRSANVLVASWLDTPLGPMLALANDERLVLLEFVERRGLERELFRLRETAALVPGRSAPIDQIEGELDAYFSGASLWFRTPIELRGTEFQRLVWDELQRIPPGETRSYQQLAASVGRPTAVRAVAQANGANQLALIVPCHRVINTNGELGGYGGGVPRKRWLLDHERRAQRLFD